jgi:Lipase (class 3)
MIEIPNIRLFADVAAATYDPKAVPMWQNVGHLKVVHWFLTDVDGVPTISCEGTNTFWEWIIDFMALKVAFNHDVYGPVHLGLYHDVMSVIDGVCNYLASKGWPEYYMDGHSKGGGEVLLGHAEMKRRGHPPTATRAFEPPRVGTSALVNYLKDEPIVWTATHNHHGTDLVTLVPSELPLAVLQPYEELDGRMELAVPDAYDIETKHRIPAVIAALPPMTASNPSLTRP